VDATCIDGDLCRRIAPATFRARRDKSVVFREPATQGEARRAEMALVTCPTGSIGTLAKRDLSAAIAAYPEPLGESIYFCGFASEDTFGGSSYLIVRPEGKVLVDLPRFTAPLVDRIEALGGARFMVLSHIDDVGDHVTFRRRFGCERVMHADDARFPSSAGSQDARRPVSPTISSSSPTRPYQRPPGAALPRRGPLHGRPPRLVAGGRDPDGFPRGLLVLLAGADALDGNAARVSLRMVLPGPGHSQRRSDDEMHAHLQRWVSWMKGVKTRARG